jgi:hypothetical protein
VSLRGGEETVGAARFWGSNGPALQAIAEDLAAAWHPDLR